MMNAKTKTNNNNHCKSSNRDSVVGSLVGYFAKGSITHSYWNGLKAPKPCGVMVDATISESANFSTAEFALAVPVTVGKYKGRSLIDVLNAGSDLYVQQDYSHWLLNVASNAITFRVNNDRTVYKINSQLVLMPDLASEGALDFDGWYTDEAYTVRLSDYEITKSTVLYGRRTVVNYTVTFDTHGSSTPVAPVSGPAGTAVKLPTRLSKDSCKFGWWSDEDGKMLSGSTFTIPKGGATVYAMWFCTKQ